jgi:hypothetical protein
MASETHKARLQALSEAMKREKADLWAEDIGD